MKRPETGMILTKARGSAAKKGEGP